MEHLNIDAEEKNVQKLVSVIDEMSLMMDVKVLLNEYYLATFDENGNSMKIALNNGQKFRITVDEIKWY